MKETLSPQEVEKLMKRYNCFVCRQRNHAFHKCGIVKRFYKVTPVSHTLPTSNTNTQRSTSTTTNRQPLPRQSRGTTSANLASLLVTVTNVPARYDGFADITQTNPTPMDNTTNNDSPVDTDNVVANNSTNSNVSPYSYSICRGSAKGIKYSQHVDPSHFLTQSLSTLPQCVVNGSATHHIWNDSNALISFHKKENGGYVQIANNQKIPIVGYGSIRITLDLAQKANRIRMDSLSA